MNYIDIIFVILITYFVYVTSIDTHDKDLLIVKIITLVSLLYLYFKFNDTFKEKFIDCYPKHSLSDPEVSINDLNKGWCSYTGNLIETKPSDTEVDIPPYIYNIEKKPLKKMDDVELDYYVSQRMHKKDNIENKHPQFYIEHEQKDKSLKSREPKVIQLENTNNFKNLTLNHFKNEKISISDDLIESSIYNKSIVDDYPAAKDNNVNEVKIDILNAKVKSTISGSVNKKLPFVLFIHGSQSSKNVFYKDSLHIIKYLLKNHISCVLIDYKDESLKTTYYKIKYIIEHLCYYENEYKLDKNKMSIVGNSLGGLYGFIHTYYSQKTINQIERIMNVGITPFNQKIKCNVFVCINPLLTIDCNKYIKLLGKHTSYCIDCLDEEKVKTICSGVNNKYMKTQGENTKSYKSLLQLFNILENIDIKTFRRIPMYIENKREKNYSLVIKNNNLVDENNDIRVDHKSNIQPAIFAKLMYNKFKDTDVKLESNIPLYYVNKKNEHYGIFIKKYLIENPKYLEVYGEKIPNI